jgi:N-acetylglucosaminyldiphosphoundecaprenol N-acetyl-beta-D-mannosaminyltransferase
MPKGNILGIHLDVVDKSGLCEAIVSSITEGSRDVYAYANIHAINLAQQHPRFKAFLNSAHVVYCDGEGVRLGARLLGFSLPPRIVLTYWVWELCALCVERGYSMFFLGAHEDVIRYAAEHAALRFPALRIKGWHHGYFDKQGPENDAIIQTINHAAPDILLVGFGMPVQEDWIEAHQGRLAVHAILPAGSLFDYMAGVKSVAPEWMANHGLEWLYRLLQEPGRLWKRYLIGNPLFFTRVLLQALRGRE